MVIPDFEQTYMTRHDIHVRSALYVSIDTKRKVLDVVKKIGSEYMTATSYVENIVRQHLELYKDDINRIYKQKAPKTLSEMKKNCFARMRPSLKTASVSDAPASVVAAPEDSSNPTPAFRNGRIRKAGCEAGACSRTGHTTATFDDIARLQKTFLVRVDYDLRASLYVSALRNGKS